MASASTPKSLACLQGGFYVVMGLWPLFHYRSFIAVTGPKVDDWLVKTVGLLVASMGATLVVGARDDEVSSTSTLGLSGASVLGAVSLYYASKRRISRIYLLDAAVEAALAAAWTVRMGQRLVERRRADAGPARIVRVAACP